VLLLIITAISLSIDALSVGISYGISKKSISIFNRIIMSIICFLMTFSALNLGCLIKKILPYFLINFLGSFILFLIGLSFIFKSLLKTKKNNYSSKENETRKISYKNINITESVILGFVLSADSFTSAFAISMADLIDINKSVALSFLISISQFLLLSLGLVISKQIYKVHKLRTKLNFEVLSGIVLILIALTKFF
jgi:putative Mn2+ efflux pump MntP